MLVKTRKVSKTTVLTVPSSFKVPVNVNFEPYINENGDIIYKRVSEINPDQVTDIHQFMDEFKPLMEFLKDK